MKGECIAAVWKNDSSGTSLRSKAASLQWGRSGHETPDTTEPATLEPETIELETTELGGAEALTNRRHPVGRVNSGRTRGAAQPTANQCGAAAPLDGGGGPTRAEERKLCWVGVGKH